MTINTDLRRHGYLAPIPRSPAIIFTEPEGEQIPSPYCYQEMLGYESKEDIKKRFMQNCNHARWKHIRNATPQAKK